MIQSLETFALALSGFRDSDYFPYRGYSRRGFH